MKLRKCLALFLAAALIAPVLPQRGSTASASEIAEDAGAGENDILAETESPDSEPGGGNEGSVEESGTLEGQETANESDKLVKPETADKQGSLEGQDTTDEPEGEERKNLESTEAPEESGTGETAEATEPEQTDQETSADTVITETDTTSNDTASEKTKETNEGNADLEESNNADGAEVQDENSAQETVESEILNEVLAVNQDDGLEIQEGDIASGVDGNIIWRIDANGKLTVNGTGDVNDTEAWPWRKSYSRFIISAEINVIGMTDASGIFSGCVNLSSLDLSGFDTSKVTNMRSMFSDCNSLADLDLSNFDTSEVTDMRSMFSDCYKLIDLDLSSFDTSKVTDMGRMFDMFYRSNLISLDLSSFDTSKVTDMERMFNGCDNLVSLDLSNFDTSKVTDMGHMFDGCSNLISLDLSSFNISEVTNMYSMFSGCVNLSSLDLSSFDTSKATDMGRMFDNCNNLISLDLSSFNTSEVTNMHGMFDGCGSLISLNLSSLDTSKVADMSSMFNCCFSLSNLDLSNFDTSKVTDMNSMFSGCYNLIKLNLRGLDTSKVTNMNYMFEDCASLSSLDLSGFDTSKVTGMEMMFNNCRDLIDLDLSNFDMSNVESARNAIDGCVCATIHTPRNVKQSISLPLGTDVIWLLPDGTEVTELPRNLDYSVVITRRRNPKIITTTPDLNMDDVIRVKYVPYSYTVETNNWDEDNKVTFSIEKGELAEGLQIYPETGEIYGVPLETGEFPITVKASYSNPEYFPSYANLTLTVLDNTDNNVLNASDEGYELEKHIGSQVFDSADSFSYVVTESADQLFVSAGEYNEFIAFWLNGEKLVAGEDYISESGSTRITIRKQTFEEKADQNGTNTIAAEFRVGGKLENPLRRTAQNFRMDLQGGNSNEEHNSGSGSRSRREDSNGSPSGAGTENGHYATSVIRLVDASGNPLPDTVLELHSTPQEARTDQNGIAVFAGVESGIHTLYAKDGNGTVLASRGFELIFGEKAGINGDQITVKAGTAFTLNVQAVGNELKFLSLQEGDLYQVVSAMTDDDASPAAWFILSVLSAGAILGSSLIRRRKQYAG